ncbi:hypothetical protein [Geodermatophilus arenarius]|uniref:Uncharacterized protein n=1 Tax=Geodermatophilus arenarius TaxID=1137990 RepID=A0ABV9LMM3_9ACTN
MTTYEYDLATTRLRELRAEADAAGRVRRLPAARWWARRAEYASRRAARAGAAVRGTAAPPQGPGSTPSPPGRGRAPAAPGASGARPLVVPGPVGDRRAPVRP